MISLQPSQCVEVLRTPNCDPTIPLPEYASDQAAGMDIRANLAETNRVDGVTLAPGERALIPTGIQVAIPENCEMLVRPRSGLALRHGVTLVNAPGTVDADYRGEISVLLINHGAAAFTVKHGDRIAQIVLAPVLRAQLKEVKSLPKTARGAGGFGSTGR